MKTKTATNDYASHEIIERCAEDTKFRERLKQFLAAEFEEVDRFDVYLNSLISYWGGVRPHWFPRSNYFEQTVLGVQPPAGYVLQAASEHPRYVDAADSLGISERTLVQALRELDDYVSEQPPAGSNFWVWTEETEYAEDWLRDEFYVFGVVTQWLRAETCANDAFAAIMEYHDCVVDTARTLLKRAMWQLLAWRLGDMCAAGQFDVS